MTEHFWQPRCQGCARFVAVVGYAPGDYRWCDRCADALPFDIYRRQAMMSRGDAEQGGWPMWPLSDVLARVTGGDDA